MEVTDSVEFVEFVPNDEISELGWLMTLTHWGNLLDIAERFGWSIPPLVKEIYLAPDPKAFWPELRILLNEEEAHSLAEALARARLFYGFGDDDVWEYSEPDPLDPFAGDALCLILNELCPGDYDELELFMEYLNRGPIWIFPA